MATTDKRLRTVTNPHSIQDIEQPQQISRMERKVRQAFGRAIAEAPDLMDNLIDLAYNSDSQMVRYLATKTALSAIGLGEIQKQVQKTTTEIRNGPATKTLEETLSKAKGPEIDELLIALEKKLLESQIDGEFTVLPEAVKEEIR